MDTDSIDALGLDPLTALLESYGRWPMTFSNWTQKDFDWRKASQSIRVNLGESFLFELYNTLDTNNTDVNVIYVRRLVDIFQIKIDISYFLIDRPVLFGFALHDSYECSIQFDGRTDSSLRRVHVRSSQAHPGRH